MYHIAKLLVAFLVVAQGIKVATTQGYGSASFEREGGPCTGDGAQFRDPHTEPLDFCTIMSKEYAKLNGESWDADMSQKTTCDGTTWKRIRYSNGDCSGEGTITKERKVGDCGEEHNDKVLSCNMDSDSMTMQIYADENCTGPLMMRTIDSFSLDTCVSKKKFVCVGGKLSKKRFSDDGCSTIRSTELDSIPAGDCLPHPEMAGMHVKVSHPCAGKTAPGSADMATASGIGSLVAATAVLLQCLLCTGVVLQ